MIKVSRYSIFLEIPSLFPVHIRSMQYDKNSRLQNFEKEYLPAIKKATEERSCLQPKLL